MSEGMGGNQTGMLKAFVERVERVEEEIDALNDDKKEIYSEAGETGFNKKVLKKVIADRRAQRKDREKHAVEADLFDLYMAALAGEDPKGAARAREAVDAAPSSQPKPEPEQQPAAEAEAEAKAEEKPKKAPGKKRGRPSKKDKAAAEAATQDDHPGESGAGQADEAAAGDGAGDPAPAEVTEHPDPDAQNLDEPDPATVGPGAAHAESPAPEAEDDDNLFDDGGTPEPTQPASPAVATAMEKGFEVDDSLDIPPALDRRGGSAA